jgi:hypothetical protein
VLTAAIGACGAVIAMTPGLLARIGFSLRHAVVWVLVPVIVATVVYGLLWQRYEWAHAAAERLPTAVAAELAQLPPKVSSMVAITFTSVALDRHPSREALAGHLRDGISLTDAPGLRIRAAVLGPRTAAISFSASSGRAGCAAVRFGHGAAVRVAYALTRRGACEVSERLLHVPPGASP